MSNICQKDKKLNHPDIHSVYTEYIYAYDIERIETAMKVLYLIVDYEELLNL